MSYDQTQYGERQRSKSMLSFKSNKSDKTYKSKSSGPKIDNLTETHEEKAKRKIKSKADPTVALGEQEPAALANERTNRESLRAIQHRDVNGNLIIDPDRSNPTRNRWERPLDTIRSFEAAIDGEYNRKQIGRSDSSDALNNFSSRRSSYQQGYSNQRMTYDGAYYGNRQGPSRPDSYVDGSYGSYGGHPPNPSPFNRPRYSSRMSPGPGPMYDGYTGHQTVYPTQGYQHSYDTVTSASGTASHATDMAGNSTDPSSENSSIDRMQHTYKPEVGEASGYGGMPGPSQFRPPSYGDYGQLEAPPVPQASAGYGRPLPPAGGNYDSGRPPAGRRLPPVPPKDTMPAIRTPIKLNGPASPEAYGSGQGDKRKSWFKRFSRTG